MATRAMPKVPPMQPGMGMPNNDRGNTISASYSGDRSTPSEKARVPQAQTQNTVNEAGQVARRAPQSLGVV